MKSFHLILIFITLSIHAMGIESDTDDISQSPKNTFTNPFTGKQEKTYQIHDVVKEIVNDKINGKINYSYNEIEQALININPNLKLSSIKNALSYGISQHVIDKDQFVRNEAINYLKNDEDENHVKIEVIKAGVNPSEIFKLSSENFQFFMYHFFEKIPPSEIYHIVINAGHLPEDIRNTLLATVISIYIQNNYDFSQITPAITSIGLDISSVACNYLDITISYLTEEDEPGTLSNIERAKENGFYDENMFENYKYNSQKIAEIVGIFSDLGFSSQQTCSDGRTLNQVIAESGEFKLSDIEMHYPTFEEEAPCTYIPNDLSIKSIFNGCDISHIIWQLERQDSPKNHKDVTYIWGEEVGDCNIMLMTRKVKNENYMHFRVRNRSGAEKEIYAKPTQIINLISK